MHPIIIFIIIVIIRLLYYNADKIKKFFSAVFDDNKSLNNGSYYEQTNRNTFFEMFFRCLGKLAKTDGRVSQAEAKYIRSLMNDIFEFDEDTKKQMNVEFKKGKDSNHSFEYLLIELKPYVDNQEAAECIVATLCELAVIDDLTENKKELLLMAGNMLNCSYVVDFYFTQNNYKNDTESIEKYYAILEISPNATDAEVKAAWKQKTKEFHPDKIQGKGLSDAFIKLAEQKLQDINEAYDMICKYRNIK